MQRSGSGWRSWSCEDRRVSYGLSVASSFLTRVFGAASARAGRACSTECERSRGCLWRAPGYVGVLCPRARTKTLVEDIVHSETVAQPLEPQEEELEFEDEEQLAVVTVVEDFTTESLMDPAPQPTATGSPAASRLSSSKDSKVRAKEGLKVTSKPKLKAKTSRFHYETKAGRNAERTKQRARRTEKAERAGGKKKRGTKR